MTDETQFKVPLPPNGVVRRIERITGQSVEEILAEPLHAKRNRVEKKHNNKLRVVRMSPVIGRGCVLSEQLKTTEKIDKELDALIYQRTGKLSIRRFAGAGIKTRSRSRP